LRSTPSIASFETAAPTGLIGLFGVLIVAGAAAVIARGNHQNPWLTLLCALVGIWFVLMFLCRSRPLIEIAEDQLRFRTGARFWFSTIAFRDVSQVEEARRFWPRLRLGLRSGRTVRVSLGELKPSDRKEVVHLIRQRIAKPERPTQSGGR
jgi:hypothetical protein